MIGECDNIALLCYFLLTLCLCFRNGVGAEANTNRTECDGMIFFIRGLYYSNISNCVYLLCGFVACFTCHVFRKRVGGPLLIVMWDFVM